MSTFHTWFCLLLLGPVLLAQDQKPVELRIRADQRGVQLSPLLYGLMTEEINYSYDGGLYAELIRNRSMREDASGPVHWQLVQEKGGAGFIALDAVAAGGQQVGVSNDGFWGIPVRPATRYRASFYAKADSAFSGPLTISIVSSDGATVHASARIPRITTDRAKYPRLKIISTTATPSSRPDVIDEHYYRRSEDEMASHAHDYDARPRTGPKVFVGEWATRVGEPDDEHGA